MVTESIGTRVGAILSVEDNVVRFLGYGVYEGNFEYPGTAMKSFEETHPSFLQTWTPEQLDEARQLFNAFRYNPRIKLDNGDVVWGRECWWAPEEEVKERLEGQTIIMCKIVRDEAGRAIEGVDVEDTQ